MCITIEEIRREVFSLPQEQRARLAEQLIASLDDLSEEEVSRPWLAKAEQRAAEIDSGGIELVSEEALEHQVAQLFK